MTALVSKNDRTKKSSMDSMKSSMVPCRKSNKLQPGRQKVRGVIV